MCNLTTSIVCELVNSQFFHLLAMLLCLLSIVWLFVRYYNSKQEVVLDRKIQLLHTLYVSGILLFFIVELITAVCVNNSRHAEIMSYVSFAATLSSLIMSIVAIIFTIVSSHQGEEQYKKIDNASDKVTDALGRFAEKTKALDESVSNFQRSSEFLSEQMTTILSKLGNIENITKEVKEQLPHQTKEKQGPDFDGSESAKVDINQLVVRIINTGSFAGNLALYACVLSKEKKRSFNVSEITTIADNVPYMYGYIILATAIGIIDAKPLNNRQIEVNDYYNGLKGLLETAISKFISSSDTNSRPNYQDSLDLIKRLFEVA